MNSWDFLLFGVIIKAVSNYNLRWKLGWAFIIGYSYSIWPKIAVFNSVNPDILKLSNLLLFFLILKIYIIIITYYKNINII